MKFYSKEYTLWLMPKGQIYNKFNTLIKKLADENEGPVFKPHVTLLGEVPQQGKSEVIRLTEELVAGQKPFLITLREIGYQDFHFRTLFVKAEITAPLQALHDKAKQIFSAQNITQYMAHLSLLYGNYPNELKEQIIAEIGSQQPAQWEVNSVHLVKGGEVEDWKIVKEFTFS